MCTAEHAVQDYKTSLAELTMNNKMQINLLTILAEDYVQHAAAIVDAIEKRIFEVRRDQRMPVLYVIDSIVKNVGDVYRELIERSIVRIFVTVFKESNEDARKALFRLRGTWNADIFKRSKLYEIDAKCSQIDPAWPVQNPGRQAGVSGQQQASSQSSAQHDPAAVTHVNPRLLHPHMTTTRPDPRTSAARNQHRVVVVAPATGDDGDGAATTTIPPVIGGTSLKVTTAARRVDSTTSSTSTVTTGSGGDDRKSKKSSAPAASKSPSSSSSTSAGVGRKTALSTSPGRVKKQPVEVPPQEPTPPAKEVPKERVPIKKDPLDELLPMADSSRTSLNSSRESASARFSPPAEQHEKEQAVDKKPDLSKKAKTADENRDGRKKRDKDDRVQQQRPEVPTKKARNHGEDPRRKAQSRQPQSFHPQSQQQQQHPAARSQPPPLQSLPLPSQVSTQPLPPPQPQPLMTVPTVGPTMMTAQPQSIQMSATGPAPPSGLSGTTALGAHAFLPTAMAHQNQHQMVPSLPMPPTMVAPFVPGSVMNPVVSAAAAAGVLFNPSLPPPPIHMPQMLPPVVIGRPPVASVPPQYGSDQIRFDGPQVSNNNRIFVEGKAHDVLFIHDVAVIERNGLPHKIYFHGEPRTLVIDNMDVHLLSFGERKAILIDGEPHEIRFGAPSRELYMGDFPFRGQFGGPPIGATINGRQHEIRLGGPPPEVKIDPDPCFELARFLPEARAAALGLGGMPGARASASSMGAPNAGVASGGGLQLKQEQPDVQAQQQQQEQKPAAVDVSQLLAKLKNSGLLNALKGSGAAAQSNATTQGQLQPASTDIPPQDRPTTPPVPSGELLVRFSRAEKPPLDFTKFSMRALTIRYSTIVEQLHQKRSACTQCGLRFKSLQSAAYRRHLDDHIQQLLAVRRTGGASATTSGAAAATATGAQVPVSSSTTARIRPWYCTSESWQVAPRRDADGELLASSDPGPSTSGGGGSAAPSAHTAANILAASTTATAAAGAASGSSLEAREAALILAGVDKYGAGDEDDDEDEDDEFQDEADRAMRRKLAEATEAADAEEGAARKAKSSSSLNCAVCGDPLQEFYCSETERWRLKDGLRAGGKVYHAICHGDESMVERKPNRVFAAEEGGDEEMAMGRRQAEEEEEAPPTDPRVDVKQEQEDEKMDDR